MMLTMMCSLAISGISGMTLTVNAGNIQDKNYSYSNSSTYGFCDWEYKSNDTKVYVYPKSGPDIYYTVQGRYGLNGSIENKSETVIIPLGVQGSITNLVHESDDTYARLKFQRLNTSYVSTQGVWSPDSSRNYTIFG